MLGGVALPLGGAGSEGLLCAGLDEVKGAVIKRVPLLPLSRERHLESPLHRHTTFTACLQSRSQPEHAWGSVCLLQIAVFLKSSFGWAKRYQIC